MAVSSRPPSLHGRRHQSGVSLMELLIGVSIGLLVVVPVLTAGTFTLRATPNGAQATDPCAIFQMTHAGVRTQVATPAVPAPLTAQECWNR